MLFSLCQARRHGSFRLTGVVALLAAHLLALGPWALSTSGMGHHCCAEETERFCEHHVRESFGPARAARHHGRPKVFLPRECSRGAEEPETPLEMAEHFHCQCLCHARALVQRGAPRLTLEPPREAAVFPPQLGGPSGAPRPIFHPPKVLS
jgi:hypothetical protein